nr:lysylphosphatidylglycerol synthase domain-containing protein [Ruegeria sp. 6PALISEP08]
MTISAIGIVYASGRSGERQLLLLTGLSLALVFICLVMLSKLVDLVWRIFPSLLGRSFAEKLAGHFSSISRQPKRLLVVFLSSVTIQTALVLMSWWLGKAAGIGTDVGPWLFARPLAKIIAVLPVTLNGLGMREGVLASMLFPFGADAAAIVAAGLVWQAVMFTVGGIGAVFLFITNRIDPAAQESWAATKDQQPG